MPEGAGANALAVTLALLLVPAGLAMYVMYRNRQYFKYPNDVPSMVSMMEKYMFVVACILAVLPLYILS
jgi:uncharacterized membrane-anchored protein